PLPASGRHEVEHAESCRFSRPSMKGAVSSVDCRPLDSSMPPRTRVLLVDDEPNLRFALREFLGGAGFEVAEADSCECALRAHPAELVLLDFELPDGNALSLLPRLREIAPGTGVVLLTAHAT